MWGQRCTLQDKNVKGVKLTHLYKVGIGIKINYLIIFVKNVLKVTQSCGSFNVLFSNITNSLVRFGVNF